MDRRIWLWNIYNLPIVYILPRTNRRAPEGNLQHFLVRVVTSKSKISPTDAANGPAAQLFIADLLPAGHAHLCGSDENNLHHFDAVADFQKWWQFMRKCQPAGVGWNEKIWQAQA